MQNEQTKEAGFLSRIGLTNNQLKIIAMIAMTCDHVGKFLFPDIIILQIIGRLAFPIFAYMIAEGCKYTKNRKRYLLQLACFGLLMQAVVYIVEGLWYLNIFLTFTLSITAIFALERFINKRSELNYIILLLAVALVFFFGYAFYTVIPLDGYYIDYGILGVLFPVVIYFAPNKWLKIASATVMMALFGILNDALQFYMLLTVPLFILYNGTRGKAKLKYLFYFFYPLHMLIIYGLYVIKYWEYFFG